MFGPTKPSTMCGSIAFSHAHVPTNAVEIVSYATIRSGRLHSWMRRLHSARGNADSPSDGPSVQALRNTRLPRRLRVDVSGPNFLSQLKPDAAASLAACVFACVTTAASSQSGETMIAIDHMT